LFLGRLQFGYPLKSLAPCFFCRELKVIDISCGQSQVGRCPSIRFRLESEPVSYSWFLFMETAPGRRLLESSPNLRLIVVPTILPAPTVINSPGKMTEMHCISKRHPQDRGVAGDSVGRNPKRLGKLLFSVQTKQVDMFWIGEVFGSVISLESEQLSYSPRLRSKWQCSQRLRQGARGN
jgi:hypothetical protein